nr:uncharacterized protein LOC129453022 [Misgurnus anguillicaudatus]
MTLGITQKMITLSSFVFVFAGVSGDDVTVTVMKGDDVTLNPNVIHEMLRWKFKDIDITTIEQFSNRLNVNSQTGYLTIQNIRTEDTGEYKLEIKTIMDKLFKPFKTFNVIINDKVESVSVMKEDSITLDTKTPTQPDDVIEWKFKNTLIAKMDRRIHPQPDPVLGERFSGRLHVDLRGSLIITHIKTNESGLYDVNITNSKHIIQKRFSVTVTGEYLVCHISVFQSLIYREAEKAPAQYKAGDFHSVHQGRGETISPKKTKKSLLQPAQSWEMRVDLGRRLVFPQARKIIMIELTVPWEDGCKEAYERKATKYQDLVEQCRAKGWQTWPFLVEVWCRGSRHNLCGRRSQLWRRCDSRRGLKPGSELVPFKKSEHLGMTCFIKKVAAVTSPQLASYYCGDAVTALMRVARLPRFSCGVFSAYVTVSVMKGDNVTLNPNVIHEMLRWKFKDIDITTIEQFRNRLNVDSQTGSLFIQNIRTEDTGEYKLEIKRSTDKTLTLFKTFNVTLNDQVITVCSTDLTDSTITNIKSTKVEINCGDFILNRTLSVYFNADKVKSVSGVKGETVILNTDTQPQADDVIEWKLNDTLIAKMDRKIPSDYFLNETLRDRLNVDWHGSLFIKNLTTEDLGLYDVNIKSSKYIIYKRFNVTVTGSHREKICTLLFVPVMMLVKVLV